MTEEITQCNSKSNLNFPECFSPQNLQDPQAEEEAGSDEEEEDEEEDEEDDEITSAESDDSEEEVDVQLPTVERQSRKGHNWDKARISY